MAKQLNAKVKKSYRSPISRDLTVYSVKLAAQDINNWKLAINMAKSAIRPRRKALYELYENVMLDGHLQSVVEKREKRLTNKRIVFDPKNKGGEHIDWIEDNITQTPWFYQLNKLGCERVPYGHSLVELIPKHGFIDSVEPIDRINVRPEDEFMQFSYANYQEGIYFKEDPYYSKYLISFGGKKDYGKLMSAAQYAIYKRGGFGDLAQFVELFGMPFRTGKYNPYDTTTREDLKKALEEMSGAGFAVIPEGTSLDFHNTTSTGQTDGHKLLIEACNAEMSKIFLGQTMTTEDGSSKSQSETHRETESDIILSDMIEREYLLNCQVIPKLKAIGYPIPEGRFRFEDTKEVPKEKLVEIAVKVAQNVPIADEWWYETFDIEKPTPEQIKAKLKLGLQAQKEFEAAQKKEEKEDPPKGDPPKNDPPKKKEEKPQAKLDLGAVGMYYNTLPLPKAEVNPMDVSLIERIAQQLHDGTIKAGQIDPELYLWIKKNLWGGVVQGFGGDISSFDADTPDAEILKLYQKDVQIFSGFKSHSFLRTATNFLTEEGKIVPFNTFKKKVLDLNADYNVNYLRTEYNMAVAQGQMGSIWAEVQRDKEITPFLQIQTVGDDRVRASHQERNGITLPVDHDFWKTNWPPFGWGCRCTVKKLISVDSTDENKVKDLPSLPKDFANNTGIDGTIFPKNHPYYSEASEKKVRAQVNKIERDNG